MRTMENPVHIQAYKAFGIIPTPMAFTEVFTALQQGTVDGQENPLSVITAAKLDQVQKYMTLTGHVYSPALILMSKAQWDKLSAADKQAFLEAAKEAVKANRARIDEDERKAVADLRSKGMTVVENVDKAKFQAALGPTFAEFGKKFGQDNIDRIQQLQVTRPSRAAARRRGCEPGRGSRVAPTPPPRTSMRSLSRVRAPHDRVLARVRLRDAGRRRLPRRSTRSWRASSSSSRPSGRRC